MLEFIRTVRENLQSRDPSIKVYVPQSKDIFTFSLAWPHWDIFVWSDIKDMITFIYPFQKVVDDFSYILF